jgi:DNA-binding NarL/FixJ family response regulator
MLADDHVVLRVGLRAFLEEQTDPPIEVVAEAASGEEVIEILDGARPDLILLTDDVYGTFVPGFR